MVRDEIVNRVAQSPLQSIDLGELADPSPRMALDIAGVLHQGLILKEKEFRAWAKNHAWQHYKGANVALHCSAEAIVPTWAYMLVAAKLEGVARFYTFGTLQDLENELIVEGLGKLEEADLNNGLFVIKGCGGVSEKVYVEAMKKFTPWAKSIMFGEPCSSVPVYKKPKP